MIRWWDDPQASRRALTAVDDSDVAQGVGTAVLGYHGLAAGALRPLTRRTLVDVGQLERVLASVDLEPVAKALCEATRPVLGDAAEVYGRLLATDLHRAAVSSTSQLVTTLANQGISWPQAVARAADVHGVPLGKLGKAASTLRAPVLNPLAQADVADRALMDYASHMGRAEVGEVIGKSERYKVHGGGEDEDWDESEHPRGAAGRFREKPDSQLAAPIDVEQNRNRLVALRRRQQLMDSRRAQVTDLVERRNQARPVEDTRQVEQTESFRTVESGGRERTRTVEGGRPSRRRVQSAERMWRQIAAVPPSNVPSDDLMANEEELSPQGGIPGILATPLHDRFILVSRPVASRIIKAGGFNVGQLAKLMRGADPKTGKAKVEDLPDAMTFAQAYDALTNTAPEYVTADRGDMVAIVLQSHAGIAFHESADDNTGGKPENRVDMTQLAPGGTYMYDGPASGSYIGLGFDDQVTGLEVVLRKGQKKIPLLLSINVSLKWDHDMGVPNFDKEISASDMPSIDLEMGSHAQTQGYSTERPNAPFRTGDSPTDPTVYNASKSDDDWKESEHPRGGGGRFREKPDDLTDRRAAFQRRRALKDSRRGFVAQRQVARTEQVSEFRQVPTSQTREVPAERETHRVVDAGRPSTRVISLGRQYRAIQSAGEPGPNTFEPDAKAASLTLRDLERLQQAAPGLFSAQIHLAQGLHRSAKDQLDLLVATRRQHDQNRATYWKAGSDVEHFSTEELALDFAAEWLSDALDLYDDIGHLAQAQEIDPLALAMFKTTGTDVGFEPVAEVGVKTKSGRALTWIPKVRWIPAGANNTTFVVMSEDDAHRMMYGPASGRPPFHLGKGDIVQLSELMSDNGYDSDQIRTTPDCIVHVYRPTFKDNANQGGS